MKKTISNIIVLALFANLCFVALPAVSYAAINKSIAIDHSMPITGADSVQSKIQDAIDAVKTGGGGTVTVTGTHFFADETLNLNIPAKVKLVWKAAYEEDTSLPSGLPDPLISVSGASPSPMENSGTFEVTNSITSHNSHAIMCSDEVAIKVTVGGSIVGKTAGIFTKEDAFHHCNNITVSSGQVVAEGTGVSAIYYNNNNRGRITVSGDGRVSTTGDNTTAINITGSTPSTNIIVSGGVVSTIGNNCTGISTTNTCDIRVSGGEIHAMGDNCTGIYDRSYSRIVMSGGSIEMDGTGNIGIRGNEGGIAVTGGQISGGTSIPIYVENYGVAAYRTGTCNGANCIVDSDKGIIVQVDPLLVPLSYAVDGKGITWKKGAANFFWNMENKKPAIHFEGIGNSITRSDLEWGSYKPPKKTSISKITAGKKQMKVTWKKLPAAEKIAKYQLRYRVKGTSKWTTKTYAASKSSATVKILKKDKLYQVQVRSYFTIASTKYYSTWSGTKTSKKIK